MVRAVYIQRAPAERMTVAAALTRYLKEVTPTKRASTQAGEHKKAQVIIRHLGKYSLAALNAEIVAQFRDTRLAGDPDKNGKLRPRSNNTVCLELALLGHLFTVAIKVMVFDYIERFYNTRRQHSTLGYVSPMQFEAAAC
jgi:hypothetical protein